MTIQTSRLREAETFQSRLCQKSMLDVHFISTRLCVRSGRTTQGRSDVRGSKLDTNVVNSKRNS